MPHPSLGAGRCTVGCVLQGRLQDQGPGPQTSQPTLSSHCLSACVNLSVSLTLCHILFVLLAFKAVKACYFWNTESQWSFHLYFPNGSRCWELFHIFIGHLNFFPKVFSSFAHLLIGMLVLVMLIFLLVFILSGY